MIVNRFVVEEAAKRRVTITPLSYFVAEFKGNTKSIQWFRENYEIMLCAFNPRLVTDDDTLYTSCMKHARDWIDLVEKGLESDIMLQELLFCPNCCTRYLSPDMEDSKE